MPVRLCNNVDFIGFRLLYIHKVLKQSDEFIVFLLKHEIIHR